MEEHANSSATAVQKIGAAGDKLQALGGNISSVGQKFLPVTGAVTALGAAAVKTAANFDSAMSRVAAASGEDLATTSDIVTDALTAFGMSASDSGCFADILAAASSNTNTNVSMMGETFKYCAPVAGALGFSAADCMECTGIFLGIGDYPLWVAAFFIQIL